MAALTLPFVDLSLGRSPRGEAWPHGWLAMAGANVRDRWRQLSGRRMAVRIAAVCGLPVAP